MEGRRGRLKRRPLHSLPLLSASSYRAGRPSIAAPGGDTQLVEPNVNDENDISQSRVTAANPWTLGQCDRRRRLTGGKDDGGLMLVDVIYANSAGTTASV